MDPIVKQLTHYIGLHDLNRKLSCFCCFSNLFEILLNVQCIHGISHLLWTFDDNTKYGIIIWSQHGHRWTRIARQAYNDCSPLAGTVLYKLPLACMNNKLTSREPQVDNFSTGECKERDSCTPCFTDCLRRIRRKPLYTVTKEAMVSLNQWQKS